MALIGTIDKLPLKNLFDEPGITQYEEGMAIPQIQTVKKEEKAKNLQMNLNRKNTPYIPLFILASIHFGCDCICLLDFY
ncbi:MAG: hypothetical protein CM1200mP10_06430 [Candidatus Neomarinimicrobiota bacterium]|nr:MAG: hypothetical protein CM1200mP10_06430 [Candidatus Neomarinimicrobiota bacterium]